MKVHYKIIMALGMGVLAQSAFAFDGGIEFGQAGFGGNGCPGGSDIQLVADENGVSFRPETWIYAGEGAERKIERKSCNLALPFQLAPGKRLVILRQEVNGLVAVTDDAKALVSQDVFFAGSQGPRLSDQLSGEGEFRLRGQAPLESTCGASSNFRINSSYTAIAQSGYSLIGIEKVSVRFKVVDCE